jgi:hypothetical protein
LQAIDLQQSLNNSFSYFLLMELLEDLSKPEPARTKEGLPMITEETVSAFIDSVNREARIRDCPGKVLAEWLEELMKENKQLVNYTRQIIPDYPEEIRGSIMAAIFSSYMLLRSQARNNLLHNYWEGESS